MNRDELRIRIFQISIGSIASPFFGEKRIFYSTSKIDHPTGEYRVSSASLISTFSFNQSETF